MRIIFVRHAHPDYKLDCLTELGHLQAEAAAQRLKDEPICAVYSSTSGRAMETAAHIAESLGLPIKESFDFMREIRWTPTEHAPAIAHNGHPWFTAWDMVACGQSVLSPHWQDKEPFCLNPALLEQVQPIHEQFDKLLSKYGLEREGDYYRLLKCNDSTIVMTSHGGSSSVVLSHLFNLPFPFVCTAICPDFTAITVVEFSGEEGSLISPKFEIMNDSRHIKGISTEQYFGN